MVLWDNQSNTKNLRCADTPLYSVNHDDQIKVNVKIMTILSTFNIFTNQIKAWRYYICSFFAMFIIAAMSILIYQMFLESISKPVAFQMVMVGGWHPPHFCADGFFATGYKMKVNFELSQLNIHYSIFFLETQQCQMFSSTENYNKNVSLSYKMYRVKL